jgi:hypothetical protein
MYTFFVICLSSLGMKENGISELNIFASGYFNLKITSPSLVQLKNLVFQI